MLEGHYLTISDIYKLPIMDFALIYSKILSNINLRIKKAKENSKK
jgi:hypothetical protein